MILARKVLMLTYFHMRARYRRALAGFFWVIANPILTFLIQALVFKSVLKIEVPDYPAFLMSGLLPWFFISQSLYVVTNSLVSSREVLLGFKVHPVLIVTAQVMDQFISFVAAFLVISLFVIKGSVDFYFLQQLGLTFVSTLILFFFVVLLTNLVAFWHVFYRDIQFIVQFLMNLAFYITPIFYEKQFLMEKYQWIVNWNIFYPFIQLFHHSLYQLHWTSWLIDLSVCTAITFGTAALLALSYRLKMKEFYIHV